MVAPALHHGNACPKHVQMASASVFLVVSIVTPTLIVTHKCFAKKVRFGPGHTNAPNFVHPMSNVNRHLNARSLTIAGMPLMRIVKIRSVNACRCIRKITVRDLDGNLQTGKILLSKIMNSMANIAKQELLFQKQKQGRAAHLQIT